MTFSHFCEVKRSVDCGSTFYEHLFYTVRANERKNNHIVEKDEQKQMEISIMFK